MLLSSASWRLFTELVVLLCLVLSLCRHAAPAETAARGKADFGEIYQLMRKGGPAVTRVDDSVPDALPVNEEFEEPVKESMKLQRGHHGKHK